MSIQGKSVGGKHKWNFMGQLRLCCGIGLISLSLSGTAQTYDKESNVSNEAYYNDEKSQNCSDQGLEAEEVFKCINNLMQPKISLEDYEDLEKRFGDGFWKAWCRNVHNGVVTEDENNFYCDYKKQILFDSQDHQ